MADEVQQGQSAPAPTSAPEPVFDAKDVEENKVVAALSYLWILFLVPLLSKKESAFAQFHAKQGLVLCVVWVIGSFFFWFPVIGWLAALLVFVVNIMALIKAFSGEAWKIPVVYDLSKKLNI